LSDTLPGVAEQEALIDRHMGRPRRSGCERLSGKERLVLVELARGHSTDEIGLVLSVSPHTVRTHVKNLMRKLNARTRAHAVAIALSERAIDL
jgi:DNA-binding CsgD family transcriptional regulator